MRVSKVGQQVIPEQGYGTHMEEGTRALIKQYFDHISFSFLVQSRPSWACFQHTDNP